MLTFEIVKENITYCGIFNKVISHLISEIRQSKTILCLGVSYLIELLLIIYYSLYIINL